ncbi:hypothetical protein [Saccharibacillus sp. JS10]|uniref:hypothetical protein n=1 Tax=Saccharibacillus sp. JS10 TaxID=2950552 RepID=UPI00210A926E|nr:hypothetical protein [Saccharibacillus sp. JS10]MCQ4087387.1 hypothetical protein [Saccharibacillus sp. JS10]
MSVNDMQTKFAQLVTRSTEDYLVRYSNKGLYKRALKDIENGIFVEYEFTDEEVVCQLSDGTVCKLTESIESFSCSCPSEKICKHVLIGILDYSDTDSGSSTSADVDSLDSLDSVEVELPKLDFSWLLDKNIDPLLSPFSTVRIEEAVFRLRYTEELEIQEGSLFVVKMKRSGVEVSFTEMPDLNRALCSVPGAEGEMYKLEAWFRYRKSQGLDDRDLLAGKLTAAKFSPEVLQQFRDYIGELLANGLARLPRRFADRFEMLAIAARSEGLPNLEREARGIHGDLELFFARHVRFSSKALLSRLTRTMLLIDALKQDLGEARKAQLIGQFRSKYYTVPRLDLYALGAEPWETSSGYQGITYYFYCGEDAEIYTYTQARPNYYEDEKFEYARYYRERSPWKKDLIMQSISTSMLSFRSVKVSSERRLSAGGSPLLTVVERPIIESFDFGDLCVSSFAALTSEPKSLRLFGSVPRRFKLLKVSSIQSTVYDQQRQSLTINVCDSAGYLLELIVPYHADWSNAIQRLESGRNMPRSGECYVFASIEEKGVYPISFFQKDWQLNIKLDG